MKINFLHPFFFFFFYRIPRNGNSILHIPLPLYLFFFRVCVSASLLMVARDDVETSSSSSSSSLHGDGIIVLTRSNGNYTDLVILRRHFAFNEQRALYDSFVLSPLSRSNSITFHSFFPLFG